MDSVIIIKKCNEVTSLDMSGLTLDSLRVKIDIEYNPNLTDLILPTYHQKQ